MPTSANRSSATQGRVAPCRLYTQTARTQLLIDVFATARGHNRIIEPLFHIINPLLDIINSHS